MNNDPNQNGIFSLLTLMVILVTFIAIVLAGAVVTFVIWSGGFNTANSTTALVVVQPTAAAVEQTDTPPPAIEAPTTTLPEEGRLVVVSVDWQLLTISPDGSDLRQLTQRADGINYAFPAWAPDNHLIAAIGSNGGGIYVLEDVAGAVSTPLYTSDITPIYLYWSPRSDEVGFITPSSSDPDLLDLNIVSTDGATESRQMASGVPFYWDWNSDGSELLFNRRGTSQASFGFLDAVNGEIRAEIDAGQFFASPDISADDAFIAYSAGLRRNQHLVVADRDGNEQNNIRHVGLIAFAWSPTKNQLAYTTPRRPFPSAYGALWLVEPQQEPRLLVDDDVITYYWSPDGTKIAYFTLVERNELELEASRNRTVLASAPPFGRFRTTATPSLTCPFWMLPAAQRSESADFCPAIYLSANLSPSLTNTPIATHSGHRTARPSPCRCKKATAQQSIASQLMDRCQPALLRARSPFGVANQLHTP